MSSAKAATEPSMEDILSSIRQIIADEDAPAEEAEQPNDQSAVDDAFDSIDVSGDEEMSKDDVDALFDDVPVASDDDLSFDSIDDDDDDDDVLELSAPEPEVAASVEEPQAEEDVAEDDEGLAFEEQSTVDVDIVPAAEPAPAPVVATTEAAALISDNVAASVKSSFGALHGGMGISSSSTIEGLMSEMLRPMLKEWLDENLPETVERLVREEIQRIQGQ
ncbi:MAG: DUF2497 domain-containing protein [Hyphomicrobiales bacterium]